MGNLHPRWVLLLCLVGLGLGSLGLGASGVPGPKVEPAARSSLTTPTSEIQPNSPGHIAVTALRLPLVYRNWPPILPKTQAIQILLDQVIRPSQLDHELLAFGLSEPLQSGETIRPYGESRAPAAWPNTATLQWFFWLDDAPGAFYEHPTRYVFVDAYTGAVQCQDEGWFPTLDGHSLWTDAAQYWAPSNWVYYQLYQGYAELLIADTGNNRVLGCDIHGNIHFEIEGLNQPSDAEFGPLGTILIADTGNNRVLVVNRVGSLFRTIPAQDPIDVEWDPYLQDIYVVQRGISTAFRINGLDTVTWQANALGGHQFARPYDMEAGPFGLSVLANTGANELLTLNTKGVVQRLTQLADGTALVRPVDAEVLPNGHLLLTFYKGTSAWGEDGAASTAGGNYVAEVDGTGAVYLGLGGWQDAYDAEAFIGSDYLIVETGQNRIVRVDMFGHVLEVLDGLSDGSRLSGPLDVEVSYAPIQPRPPFLPPSEGQCPPMQDVPSGERECALIVNGIIEGESLLGTAETDTQDLSAFFRCLGISETVRIGSSSMAKETLLSTIDRMASGCDDVVLILEGHGSSKAADPTIKVGGQSLTLPELQAKIRQYPQVDFKVIIESCYAGRWKDGLAALDNVKKVITSSDAQHESWGDMDDSNDPNPADEGSEFLSGFRADLWEAAGDGTVWAGIIGDAQSRRIGFKEALLKYAFRSAVAKDVTAGNTNPQESVDKPRTPTPTATPTRTPIPSPSPTSTPCEPLFADGFCNPASGWPVADLTEVKAEYYENTYRLTVKQPSKLIWAAAPFSCAEAVLMQVRAWRDGGSNSEYGLVWGLNRDIDEFYAFRVQPGAGQFKLTRHDPPDRWVTLISWTSSERIEWGNEPNWLQVLRSGSQITLYINNYRVATYTDSTYTGDRRVGVWAASGSDAPVVLRYDDFTVWPVSCLTSAGSGTIVTERPTVPCSGLPRVTSEPSSLSEGVHLGSDNHEQIP